jgi:hypothetical protein
MSVTAIPGGAALPLHEMFGHYAEAMRRAEAPGWNEWLVGADRIPRQVITQPSPLQAKILAAFGGLSSPFELCSSTESVVVCCLV